MQKIISPTFYSHWKIIIKGNGNCCGINKLKRFLLFNLNRVHMRFVRY